MIQMFSAKPLFPSVLKRLHRLPRKITILIQIATEQGWEERLTYFSQMVYGNLILDGLIFLYAQENDPLVQLVVDEQFPFLSFLENHFLLSFRLLIMITSKPVWCDRYFIKKDAVALLSLVVPEALRYPGPSDRVTRQTRTQSACDGHRTFFCRRVSRRRDITVNDSLNTTLRPMLLAQQPIVS